MRLGWVEFKGVRYLPDFRVEVANPTSFCSFHEKGLKFTTWTFAASPLLFFEPIHTICNHLAVQFSVVSTEPGYRASEFLNATRLGGAFRVSRFA